MNKARYVPSLALYGFMVACQTPVSHLAACTGGLTSHRKSRGYDGIIESTGADRAGHAALLIELRQPLICP